MAPGLAAELRGETHIWIPTTATHATWVDSGADNDDLAAMLNEAQTPLMRDNGGAGDGKAAHPASPAMQWVTYDASCCTSNCVLL